MNQADSCQALPPAIQQSPLLPLLSNSLVLSHIAPYLPINSILRLAATSRAFRYLIYGNPQVFRRLDLSRLKTVRFAIGAIDHGGETWRNEQVDENLTEDEFYSGPLRGIFSNLRRLRILRDVQILVLDDLSVTSDLVHDILIDPDYSVRILSLRGCAHLNERQLRGALQYACRSSRPDGSPRLKGVYIFGTRDSLIWRRERGIQQSVLGSGVPVPAVRSAVGAAWSNRTQLALARACVLEHETDAWYGYRGVQFIDDQPFHPEWAQTLVACDGLIAFDAILCTGPRHLNSRAWGTVNTGALDAASRGPAVAIPQWSVATLSLNGCSGCGSAPEGWTVWGEEPPTVDRPGERERRASDKSATRYEIGRFPLLRRAPLHSANVRVAMCPAGQPLYPRPSDLSGGSADLARFIPRCTDCLRDRYCVACHRWWCESCFVGPFAPELPHGGIFQSAVIPDIPDLAAHRLPDFKVRDGFCYLHHPATQST